ncbi:MAG: hypothetical protein ACRD6X_14505, partial [Pyrinomonadaceae bacterium]
NAVVWLHSAGATEPRWLIIRNTQKTILVMSSTFIIGSARHSRSYAFQMFQMFQAFQAFHLFQTFHRNIDTPLRNETPERSADYL